MKAVLAAWAMLILSAPSYGQAGNAAMAEPYDFKGARLGMTFEEWQAVSPPIDLQSTNMGVDKKSEPLRIWCSGTRLPITKTDSMPAVHVTLEEERAGVSTCRYGRMGRVFGRPSLMGAWISVGDGITTDVTYKFLENRLYEIEIEGVIKLYPGIVEGLNARFGRPTDNENDTVTNGYGSDFPHTFKKWRRDDSVIELEAPYKKLSFMRVVFFSQNAHAKILAAQPKGPPATSKM